MENLEFVESWEEDGREIDHYKYKGHDIFLNLYGEFEATIDDYWYTSLENACKSIDKREWYNSLDKNTLEFIEEYESRKFCSSLDGLCPYKEDCTNCSIKKAIEVANKIKENDKIKYNTIINSINN